MSSMAPFRVSESLKRLPSTTNRTRFFMKVSNSSTMDLNISFMRASTSLSGLPQFSSEKANSDR